MNPYPSNKTELPLVDISTVAVDKSLPKEERLAEYVRQIKNPYCFTCDGFTVHASFTSDGVCMENRIQARNATL